MPNKIQAEFSAFKQKVSAHYIAIGVFAGKQLLEISYPIALESLESKQ